MSSDATNQALPRIAPRPSIAGSGHPSRHEAPKGVAGEPLLWEEYLSAACPGPAGTWACALPFGHDGDHARFVEAEPVPAHDHAAENAELRSLLRTSALLLADWPFARGASFRRELIARIGKAVR